MKRFSAMIAAVTVLYFSSCNDNSKDKETITREDTTAMTAPTPPPPPVIEPVFTPFKTISIRHKVKDFNKWRETYLAHDSMRQIAGITHYRLGRGIEDSNTVIVVNKISDVTKAKEFGTSADLKNTMQKAGVIGKPGVSYFEVIRNDDSKPASADRVAVTHKVKDFAAWLKVYDEEGKAKRAENGLADRAMNRSIDDSNMVRIVFIVTDMAKAKARASSEKLKKLMTDAGVIGKPDIFWYRLVE